MNKSQTGYFLRSPCIVGIVVLGVHKAAYQVSPVMFSLNISWPGCKNVKLHLNDHLKAHQNVRILHAKCTQQHLKS